MNMNLNGKILTVIKNMYNAAKSCIMVDDEYSEFFSVTRGVRQGDSLSPVLFAIFLNDMHKFINQSMPDLETIGTESRNCGMDEESCKTLLRMFLLLYADDSVIFSETPEGLQSGLTRVKEYFDTWELKLNVEK